MSELSYVNLTADLAPGCAALERVAFPHANPEDLLSDDDIRAYAETFPEGFFVAREGTRVVGQGAGIFLDFDFEHPAHTIRGITGEHQCGNHDPAGGWYYGTDLAVDPSYRRRGIATRLYELRRGLVRSRGKRGIIGGAHLPGYADHRELTAGEYVDRVVAGDLYDPTLTFQISQGFEVRGILPDYLRDESTGGFAALIVWERR